MAMYRTPPKCLKCGDDFKAVHRPDPDNSFVGDTFQFWDTMGHKCKTESNDKPVQVDSPTEDNNLIVIKDEYNCHPLFNTLTKKNSILIGKSNTGEAFITLCDNGDILVKGKLIENDREVVEGMRELLNLKQ